MFVKEDRVPLAVVKIGKACPWKDKLLIEA